MIKGIDGEQEDAIRHQTCAAKRNSALVLDISQGKTMQAEASRKFVGGWPTLLECRRYLLF
ncbi:hypothetical protein YH64_029635 [Achromobacter sp. LC458]|uniref:hypothetical protein n=1 Tax=Achromobacter sp. LC458 TaxID=1120623 RepID=UPI00062A2216|nr:hypothetical protein [Achromobacter sp. LC458]TRM49359.1 hypothetical protein YH64_029635 [Achromobacter sp. LC458]